MSEKPAEVGAEEEGAGARDADAVVLGLEEAPKEEEGSEGAGDTEIVVLGFEEEAPIETEGSGRVQGVRNTHTKYKK